MVSNMDVEHGIRGFIVYKEESEEEKKKREEEQEKLRKLIKEN